MPDYSRDLTMGTLGQLSGDRILAPMGGQMVKRSALSVKDALALRSAILARQARAQHDAALLRQNAEKIGMLRELHPAALREAAAKAQEAEDAATQSGWMMGRDEPLPNADGTLPLAYRKMLAEEQDAKNANNTGAAEAKIALEKSGLSAVTPGKESIDYANAVYGEQVNKSEADSKAMKAKADLENGGMLAAPPGAENATPVLDLNDGAAAKVSQAEQNVMNILELDRELNSDENIMASFTAPVVGSLVRGFQKELVNNAPALASDEMKATTGWTTRSKREVENPIRHEIFGAAVSGAGKGGGEMAQWRYGWPTEDLSRETMLKRWPEVAVDTLTGYIRYVKAIAGEDTAGGAARIEKIMPQIEAFIGQHPQYREKVIEALK